MPVRLSDRLKSRETCVEYRSLVSHCGFARRRHRAGSHGEGIKVLRAVEDRLGEVAFDFEEFSVGAGEYLRHGNPLPESTLEKIRGHDAILLGAMGLPDVRWPNGVEMTPQLDLRERLDLYCGLRPIKLYHLGHSPLKAPGEIDFILVRESTEGLFSSRKKTFAHDAEVVTDTLRITRRGAERLFRAAFKLARGRGRKVTLVDKANVLPSMAYFRSVFETVACEFPDVNTECIYVDAAALYLVERPAAFDVVVTENMFGDILSDLGAALVGGMGMAPSADIGDRHAVFQPAHGSAPNIAGQGIANPVATILSAAMMLDWLDDPVTQYGARIVRAAVADVLADLQNRTPDLGGTIGTAEMGDRIAQRVAGSSAAREGANI
jgi:3-isopropylmalate dehydrogenase